MKMKNYKNPSEASGVLASHISNAASVDSAAAGGEGGVGDSARFASLRLGVGSALEPEAPASASGLAGRSVNFHLWQPCNMRCKFCFATFEDVKRSVLPKGHLPREAALEVVRLLGEAGVGKLTFAGGEPLLCPWLAELIIEAKRLGMKTMIVTNGTRLTADWLDALIGHLDWVTLSADSIVPATNQASGRQVTGQVAPDLAYYVERARLVQARGIRFKFNTVVSASNHLEDLSALIEAVKPERWKVLQALPVEGQNSAHSGSFEVTSSEFDAFIARHAHLASCTTIVPEPVELIQGSYLMLDPAGRFFDEVLGHYRYSRPVREVGLAAALEDVEFDFEKFLERGGEYDY
jgi:radical S-adenosyl methionine domain-containing protein 2